MGQLLTINPLLGLQQAVDYDNDDSTLARAEAQALYIAINELLVHKVERIARLSRLAQAGVPFGCGDGTIDAQARQFFLRRSGFGENVLDTTHTRCPYIAGIQEVWGSNVTVSSFVPELFNVINDRHYNQVGIAARYRYTYPQNKLVSFCVILVSVLSAPTC